MPGGDRAAALQAGNSWPRQARSVDHPRRHRDDFPCHRHVVADQQDVVSRPFGRISVFSLLSSNLLPRPVELGPVDPHAMQNDRELTSDRYLGLAKPVALGGLCSPSLHGGPFRDAGQQNPGRFIGRLRNLFRSAIFRICKRQDTNTPTCRLEHRVGHRRSDRRNAWFADASRRRRGFDDVNLDRRHFVDPQHVIAVEIAFDDPALVERDLRFQDRTKSKADASLHLCAHLIGINRDAAIDGADDAVHLGASGPCRPKSPLLAQHRNGMTRQPRPRETGPPAGVPQPAFSAASRRTAAWRGLSFNIVSRNSTGSLPTACAISSMKVSRAYAVCVDPTERHQSTDTGEVVVVRSTRRFGMA